MTESSEPQYGTDFVCPLPATHAKYNEAHYFISQMVSEYHQPFPFQCNLNAFLQALRSVIFMIQSELSTHDKFGSWYADEWEGMKTDLLLRRFVEGRNIIVHRGTLGRMSRVQAGLFRGRMLKLAYQLELDIDEPSETILKRTQEVFVGFLIDEDHSAIGEQLGVQRSWIVEELGDEEVISLCDRAWARIGKVVGGAHSLVGASFEPPPEESHDLTQVSVLLESDVEPALLEKWPW